MKELNKNDFEEYKDLERFICERNLIKIIPGNLFDDLKYLEYIKFFNNNTEIIEPNILDRLENLKYANFKENQIYHDFYAENPIYNSNINLQELKDSIFERLFALDQEVLWNFIKRFPNPNEILNIFSKKAFKLESKLSILELRMNLNDEMRMKEVEEHQSQVESLKYQIEDLKDSETNLKHDVDELKDEVEEISRINQDLQLQIDNLTVQLNKIV